MRGPFWVLAAVLVGGCRAPGATELDEHASWDFEVDAAADLPAEELSVEPLELDGVRGASVQVTLDGEPDEVLEMLLDFERAQGNRAWAEAYEVVSREADRVVARWTFAGKAGLNPTIELEFVVERREDPVYVTYEAIEPSFGLAAFFGDYTVVEHPDAGGGRSVLRERVYVDSGLPFANATAEDLERGLREDARRMRAWMRER